MLNPVRRIGAPLFAALALGASPAAWAQDNYAGAGDTLNMGPGIPDYYTVQPGDTLLECLGSTRHPVLAK